MNDDIIALTQIDFSSIFISVLIILIGVKSIVSLFEWIVNKLGLETKWMRKKREDHELLVKTSQNLLELQSKHKTDVKLSIAHDEKIQDELSNFMNEMREYISQTQTQIETYADNRVHDRQQSLNIQEQWSNTIQTIANGEKDRDEQIKALMCGSKELLGAEIDRRYREYIALDGIPETEVDEFDDIFMAYKGLNGNHNRDIKYDYVKNHLRVIPVKTKLITNKEN